MTARSPSSPLRSYVQFALLLLAWIGLAGTGCGTVHGPSIEYTAPGISGRAVDAVTGAPVRGARVGRTLYSSRGANGEPRKGGEELLYLQSFTSTDGDGNFELPVQRAALLFRFGEMPLNLRLAIQARGYVGWTTNYPLAAIGTNDAPVAPRIDAGAVPLQSTAR